VVTGSRNAPTGRAIAGRPGNSAGSPRTPYLRKGVDEFLAENGIKYFFVDGHLLKGGEALGVYADKFGPLKEIWKQFSKETVKLSTGLSLPTSLTW